MEGKELIIMKHGSLVMKLPPGFRFHPTDEELVVQYLKRKAFSCPLPASIIPEIDLCNYNPWDLPSGFGGERYFFNLRERKCESKRIRGFMMMKQATKSGYWKPTGKEKPVFNSRGQEVVGSKQVLVFYRGKPHHGSKTDWIMHEYRLNETIKFLYQSKEWVVCHIFENRRYMKLKAKIITSHVPATTSTFSTESCITDISDEEDSVNGEEAMSRN